MISLLRRRLVLIALTVFALPLQYRREGVNQMILERPYLCGEMAGIRIDRIDIGRMVQFKDRPLTGPPGNWPAWKIDGKSFIVRAAAENSPHQRSRRRATFRVDGPF